MNKSLKKALALLLAIMMIMTSFVVSPLSANAATPVALQNCNIGVWADPENVLTQNRVNDFKNKVSTTTILGGVQPFQIATSGGSGIGGGLGGLIPGGGSSSSGTGNYYLFLPSNTDCSSLKLWVADGSTLSIGGTPIVSGEPTNIFEALNEGGISQNYTFTLDSKNYTVTVMKSGRVGTVYIDTTQGDLTNIYKSKNNSDTGMIMVVQPDGTVDYKGDLAKINGRGNGTWSSDNAKNPYSIKLAESTSLLGMGKAKKWALLAGTGSGRDKTLIANQMTYDFSDYIGVKYQVHCKPVDLYVNQQYLGSYQLAEKVEIKSNRVALKSDAYENLELANGTTNEAGILVPADLNSTNTTVTSKDVGTVSSYGTSSAGKTPGGMKYLTKVNNQTVINPTDITGGYIYQLEISKRWAEEESNGFAGYNRQCWIFASGDYATKEMTDYSFNLFYALGGSVYNNGTVPSTSVTTSVSNSYGGNTVNPAPTKYVGMRWSDLLDADSAVRYYWTQEFFKNMDGSTSSTYFYKEADAADGTLSKLYAGPVWDMDNIMGQPEDTSRWGISLSSTDKWYTKNTRIYRYNAGKSENDTTAYPLAFYGALATNCNDFWAMAEDYWYSTVSPAVDILLGRSVDETGKLRSLSDYVNTVSNSAKMDGVRHGTTYDASSVINTYTNWISGRQTWINSQIAKTAISSAILNTIPDQVYTGSEIRPELSLTYNDGILPTQTLKEGVDYIVSYSNNVNIGTANVTITGINGYEGTRTTTFRIVAGSLNNASLTIDSQAYTGTQLAATLKDASGNDITPVASYQWYKNNEAIIGATDSIYTISADDADATLKVVASGNGYTLTGNSIESNTCLVLSSEKPVSYTRTIASWDYDYTADSTTLVNEAENPDGTATDFRYVATGGEAADSAKLYASVNAADRSIIKWSSSSDLYANDSNTVTNDRVPVMSTSKSDLIAWGTYPYFETVVSTAGYEKILFSAKLGGTKKAPKSWKLQYSLNGTDYTDVPGASYSITANKTMEPAFNDVALPAVCNDQQTLYLRMVVTEDVSIGGGTIVNQLSGDAAVNNVYVKGSSLSVIDSLDAPTITTDSSVVFDDNNITITDNNGGADLYYTVNNSDPVRYTGEFNPFDAKTAKIGDTAVVKAYAAFDEIQSPDSEITVSFGGVDINSFIYSDYSDDVTAGAVQSTGGVYGKSGKMTAYTDGRSQFVPLWRADNGSFCVAPDDGAKWSANSGFTYKVSTAGYENVSFSCKAYTTTQGPKSITLQYSTNGTDFYNVESNVALTANSALEQVFLTTDLPAACDNQRELYIRLATTENSTFGGTTLHNNDSKGNLYVNDVVVSGEDNGDYKMPYTNKSTAYFGENGTVKYVSPDGIEMHYVVFDSSNNIVLSGTYPETGIQLSLAEGFDRNEQEAYTIVIEAVEDEDTSIANTATYYFKGDTVVKFNYSTKNAFDDNSISVDSTGGANTGSISMYPDGSTATALSFNSNYGIRASWSSGNPFTSNKQLDRVNGNGYWLIETSTKGFTNLTLNLDQLSSNKGPRDWGIAYSTNGTTYTYVDNSNARAISNDASTKPVETYGNLPLPSACDNQDNLYIKVFINGGESVDGTELELVTKGNTGINGLEISGIAIPEYEYVDFTTTLLEDIGDTTGSIAVSDVEIYVNGKLKATTDANGTASVPMPKNAQATVKLKGDGIAARTVNVTTNGNTAAQNVAVMAYDVNNDGYVNAKDFAIINKRSKYSAYKPFFSNFINVNTENFTY